MMSQTDSILNLLNIQDPNIKISACTDFSGRLSTKNGRERWVGRKAFASRLKPFSLPIELY